MFKLTPSIGPTLLLIACCLMLTWSTTAQTATATLSGTLVDQSSAVVPGVTITVQNDATSFVRTATTNAEGSFTVPLLPPGKYTITAVRSGFASVRIPNVALNVGDQKAINVQLKVGDVNAQIEVRPDETLVSTSPAVATTIDRNFVQNMPLNGRSFQSLILLTPGVVPTVSNTAEPGQFSVNGQRTNTNYFTVDGVSANTGVNASSESSYFSEMAGGALPGFTALGTTSSLVSVDALEEFKIQTSTYSAEFGRQPGGQVQLVTRSGGNDFHGSIYDYLRNDKLDARNFFNPVPQRKPPLRQNDFGGTFSGPIFLPRFGERGKPYWSGKNKSFFFFSYEGLRLLLPVLPATNVIVPSLRLRQAAPSAIQPFINALPLPTGPEITDTNGVPSGFAPFQTAWSNPSRTDAWSIRVDQNVNKKLTLFGRYGITPSNTLSRSLSTLQGTVSKSQTLTVGAISIITPNINNDLRVNYTKNRSSSSFTLDNFGGAAPVSLSALTSGYSGQGPVLGTVVFRSNPFIGQALIQQGYTADNSQRQFNVVDNVSMTKGKHGLKFGLDWRRLSPTFGPTAFSLGISFYSQAGILNGSPDTVDRLANQVVKPIYDNFSAYAQDTWKVSNRLILDFGLRWEVNPPPHDANGVNPVIVTGIQGGDVSKATLAPAGTPFYKTFYGGVSPRLGIAYTLKAAAGRETVLRGGFGMYNDLGSGSAVAGFSYFPWSVAVTTLGAFFGQSAISFPLPSNLTGPPPFPTVALPLNSVGSLYGLNPNLKLPYTLEWSAAVQQSLGKDQTVTLSYVGSAGRRLLATGRLNQPDPITHALPNPNFGNLRFIDNGPTSDYHAFQGQYQGRLSHGLQLLANYTWSHAIDVISNELGNYGGAGSTETQDRGNANFDLRHNFSLAATYNLPALRGTGALTGFGKGILNGWSIDPILYLRSGFPLDIYAPLNFRIFADGTQIAARPDLIQGVPIWVKDSTVPGGRRINVAAFATPPLIPGSSQAVSRQGTLGRNSVIGPGMYQINLALRRRIAFGEKLGVQLGLEVFNIDNHPMFGQYATTWAPNFSGFGKPRATLSNGLSDGRITAGALNSLYQLGGPRSIQLSARISF